MGAGFSPLVDALERRKASSERTDAQPSLPLPYRHFGYCHSEPTGVSIPQIVGELTRKLACGGVPSIIAPQRKSSETLLLS